MSHTFLLGWACLFWLWLAGLMVQYYGDRTYARFYALETIARVPYFGYLCVLHLYETLGQWRQVS